MEITANSIQEVTLGNNVIFTETPVPGNCSILHREGSGVVKLRAVGCSQQRARYRVFFSGNIAIPEDGTAPGQISLAISVDGEAVATSKMIVTPAEVNNYFNVSSSIYLDVPKGYYYTIGVKNTDGPAINVQNANLIVERVA